MKDSIREIIITMGEDPNGQGLLDTPKRVMESMEFLTRGYKQNLSAKYVKFTRVCVYHRNTAEPAVFGDDGCGEYLVVSRKILILYQGVI